ncbi:uncharacterized protein NPIL_257361 [Nephila pilipes]|uniref:Gustatory receptor n=1 Tax=Nephila pilipes TaxID=299642 RepID=A0A8X6MQK6_NEPPI|nr:uncharacterized protein NPIL_257361 [Nephila pilipes]
MGVISAVYRCSLTKHLNQLKRLPRKLERFGRHKYGTIIWIVIFSIPSILTPAFALLYITISPGHANEISEILFGFTFESQNVSILLIVFHALYTFFFCTVPIIGFELFYTQICIHIRNTIDDFSKSLSRKSKLEYDKVLKSYTVIKNLVEHVDAKLCFFVFSAIFYSSCSMYISISVFLHPQHTPSIFYRVITYIYFVNLFTLFIAMTASAASVTEASLKVQSIAWKSSVMRKETSLSQLKFAFFAEKGISLTVWNVVPISRNFIFGMLGAILTYVILFDSLIERKYSS